MTDKMLRRLLTLFISHDEEGTVTEFDHAIGESVLLEKEQKKVLRRRTRLLLMGFIWLNFIWMATDYILLPGDAFEGLIVLRVVLFLFLSLALYICHRHSYRPITTWALYLLPVMFFYFSYNCLLEFDLDGVAATLFLTYENIPVVCAGLIGLMPYRLRQASRIFGVILFIATVTHLQSGHNIATHYDAILLIVLVGGIATIASVSQYHLFSSLTLRGSVDWLTGALLRRAGEILLSHILSSSRRHDSYFILVMLDLDHFKQVNDMFGHNEGDAVLADFSKRILRNKRASDVLVRWGGEEFLLGLEVTGLDDLVRVLTRILGQGFGTRPDGVPITVSAGVVNVDECEGDDLQELTDLADQRVYLAKEAGRDRIIGFGNERVYLNSGVDRGTGAAEAAEASSA